MRAVEFLVGSVVEAWGEFRTHKARVILSLIGVALAVLALTGVAAIGAVAQQSVTESLERSQGRPALLSIGTPYQATTGAAYSDDYEPLVSAEIDRFGIDWWSRIQYTQVTAATPEGTRDVQIQAVDADWGTMHRVRLSQGSWFRDGDADRLAPAMIVDTVTWKALGSPDLRTHPTVRIVGPAPATAVIIGVTPGGYPENYSGFLLYDAYQRLTAETAPTADELMYGPSLSYEAWVPPSQSEEISSRMASDLQRRVGEGWQVDVSRSDYQAYGGPDPLLLFKIVVGAAAGLILLLGALGLVNISMVTVRTRVREIGIRRSFGSTAARVFLGVMMESVVATVAAGVVGVLLAILALKNPWVTDWLKDNAGLQDVPGFPFSAALFGLLVAAGVGALAGLLPAIVAVRVKPIDAIRY